MATPARFPPPDHPGQQASPPPWAGARPGGGGPAADGQVSARQRLRDARERAARLRNCGHHRFDHLATQALPWAALFATAAAGFAGWGVMLAAHHHRGAVVAVAVVTWLAAGLAGWRAARRCGERYERWHAWACAAVTGGWVTWLTLAGPDGSGRLALAGLVPGWIALALPWWLAHPHVPEPEPEPEVEPEPEPDPYPLIAQWAREVAVNGVLPGSALSQPEDTEAGTRYLCSLQPGMALEDAENAQRKVASILGIGRHRLLFEKRGSQPGRADNERIIVLTVLNEVIRQHSTQEWVKPTLNRETGMIEIGIYPDTPALCRLYQVLGEAWYERYRACHWMIAGLPGGGKSRALELAILEMLSSGMFVVWYADGQGGVSSPDLRDHVDWYADWHDEIVRMVFAAYAVMKARQRFLRTWKWKDKHGRTHTGAGFFPWAAGMPFLEMVIDEAHEPLRDQRISKTVRELMRLGPKVGIGVAIATQITSVLDLGGASGDMGAQGLRAFAKNGGNVLLFRGGETLTTTSMGVPGVSIDPRTLPIDPPGMCYAPFGQRPEVEIRAYHTPPDELYDWLARANKAALDAMSVMGAGEEYATRHDRVRPDEDASEELAYLLGEKIRGGVQDTSASAKAAGSRNLARVYQAVTQLTRVNAGPVKREEVDTHLTAQPEGQISTSSMTGCLKQLTDTGKIIAVPGRHGYYDMPGAEDLAEERAELAAEVAG